MKKFLLFLFFISLVLAATAQKVYFVYLQTEKEQPFFIKMNDKVYSSSVSGYLILSKLPDSSYHFSVGFPQNKWPEQNFTIDINKKDHGFLVKDFGEKGWGLFDLQTMAVSMSASNQKRTETTAKVENNEVSKFTDILSKAADDPSLKEKPVQATVAVEKQTVKPVDEAAKKEEAKQQVKDVAVANPIIITKQTVEPTPAEEKKTDKPNQELVKTGEANPEVKKEVAITAVGLKEKPAEPEPTVEKKADKPSQDLVKTGEGNPEVKKEAAIAVAGIKEKPADPQPTVEKKMDKPADKSAKTAEAKPEIKKEVTQNPVEIKEMPKDLQQDNYKRSVVTKRYETSTTSGFGLVFIDDYQNGNKDTIEVMIPEPRPVSVATPKKEEPKEVRKFLDITAKAPEQTIPEKKSEAPAVAEKMNGTSAAAKKCADMADETDFFVLRKKMAALKTDDEMINEAKEYFKIKCFTTEQVKNLGSLFLKDEGKYRFFDLAYPFVADDNNFSSLQKELKEEYYINRFKAMLRN